MSVFISHAFEDRDLVHQRIVKVLEGNGIKTWHATRDIKTSELWEPSIRAALDGCDHFVLAMSPAAIESIWVKAELDWALKHRRDRIVPVMLRECSIDDFHLMLPQIQFVDCCQDSEAAAKQLLAVWEQSGSGVRST